MNNPAPPAARLCPALAVAALSAAAAAQPAPIPSRQALIDIDSGFVANTGPDPAPVFTAHVHVPDAPWLRLSFENAALAGDPERGTGSYLLITSPRDGAAQRLDARSLDQWASTSAYFNGDTVLVELWAYPGTDPNRLTIAEATVGEAHPENVCGARDERLPSNQPWAARLMPIGCTAYLVTAGDCANRFLTAGHCISPTTRGAIVQFNVPFSSPTGVIQHPPPEYQYPVQDGSIQATTGGAVVGHDAATFQTHENTNTGRPPAEAQRGAYDLAPAAPPAANQTLRITGYAARRNNQDPIPWEWNQTQKTGTGPYTQKDGTILYYQVDTEGGNSGSPVILESTGRVIGVHTHGGCRPDGTGANRGTAIEHPTLQNFLANPLGTCIPFIPPNCLDTIYTSDDEGALGGAVYFDLTVGNTPIGLWGLDLNLGESSERGATFSVDVFTAPGGHAGKEADPSLWTRAGRGVGIVEPEGSPSRMLLETPAPLDSGTTYGVAIVIGNASHAYTIATGANQRHNDGNITLQLGSAADAPFSQPVITGRVWNGGLCYDLGQACYPDCNGDGVLDFFDFLCFQNAFLAQDPYADCDNNGVFDFFDFLCFQNEFLAGCP